MNAAVVRGLRQAALRVIRENSVEVAIRRVQFLPDSAGGRTEQQTLLPPFQGRVIPTKHQPQHDQDEAGEKLTTGWLLLAPHTADIRAGSGVTDSFEANGRWFSVVRVIPRRYAGELYAVHAVLREVS